MTVTLYGKRESAVLRENYPASSGGKGQPVHPLLSPLPQHLSQVHLTGRGNPGPEQTGLYSLITRSETYSWSTSPAPLLLLGCCFPQAPGLSASVLCWKRGLWSPGSSHLAQSKALPLLCIHTVPEPSVIWHSHSFMHLSSTFQVLILVSDKNIHILQTTSNFKSYKNPLKYNAMLLALGHAAVLRC